MHPTNPKTLFVGLRNVWKSTDRGETWNRISNFNLQNSHKIQALEVSPSNPQVICMSFEDPSWGNTSLEKIMITEDGGENWRNITPYSTPSMKYVSAVDITFHPKKHGEIYLALDRNWENNRIYVTHDMGQTWQSFSQGLPNIPVNAIRFYEGAGYDIMFAATDVGIFYRDAFMSEWEIFGEGLPLTIVTDIEINYKRKTLVAGTFGRGLWEAHICLPLSNEQIVIDDTITWPKNANLLGDLILMPGSMVTINSRIEVGQGISIKVMPGAHLILDGAELTNNCAGLWQGIKVYGHPDYTSDKPQGQITIINESVIENAYTALTMQAIDSTMTEIPGMGGGIVYAYRAIFKDNFLSVDFLPAKGVNPGKFILSEFILKNQPWTGLQMQEFVRIKRNNGLIFSSCLFRNEIPVKDLPFNERGYGIHAFNASFKVDKIIGDTSMLGIALKPAFFQLNKAIHATVSTPGHYFSANTVTFKNNYTGVYLSGYDYIESINCSYEVTPVSYANPTQKLVSGLYLDACPSYRVWDNTFKGPALIGTGNSIVGLVVNNCGPRNNLIAANRIFNLQYGLLIQNSNRNADGSTGLRLYNNLFKNNTTDINVTTNETLTNLTPGIAMWQGSVGPLPFEPAGNQFSYNELTPPSNFYNAGLPVVYTHYLDSETVKHQTPRHFNNLWLVQSVFMMPVDSSHRPDYLLYTPGDERTAHDTWNKMAQKAYTEFQTTEDNGNSKLLIDRIKNTNTYASHELYKALRELDSKLSEKALIALAENNYLYNDHVTSVLGNNPIINRVDTIWTILKRRIPALTNNQMQALRSALGNYSKIEFLKSRADNASAIATSYKDRLIIMLMSEDLNDVTPELESLFQTENSLQAMCTLGFMHYLKNEYSKAQHIINQAFDEYPNENINRESLLLLLDLEHKAIHNYVDTLSNVHKEAILAMQQSEYTGIYARAIALQHEISEYEEPYILPNQTPMLPVHTIPNLSIKGSQIKIYPQPATNYFVVDYEFNDDFNNGSIELADLTGKTLHVAQLSSAYGQYYIDVSKTAPGLYILRVMVSDKIMEHLKVLIVK